jgi:hypothetical protein
MGPSARELANQMVRNFGKSALHEADAIRKKFENRGDLDGVRMWTEIRNALVDANKEAEAEPPRNDGTDTRTDHMSAKPRLAKVTCTFD